MPNRLTITGVHYGQEHPEDLRFDILQILLHYLKIDPSACYTKKASDQDEPGQTATSRKHRR
ncbi:hypothetical protein GCM10025859_57430 [Alicyclobacillus fastidiosus]|nr:hypothetical protein GCM10025859_57430 [Alicyclobacillus fastidiosus]